MARTVAIGAQDFEELIRKNNFYVDKTSFIKEWWESDDKVTLITRPRRFGKTLNMNMLEPKQSGDNAIILEFKVYNPKKETSLEETVQAALDLIEEKKYGQILLAKGIENDHIRKYGLAFRGKEVLIGSF